MTALEPQFLEVVSTSALELRSAFSAQQPGVMAAGDLAVLAGPGGSRSVLVQAGIGFVRGTSVTDQGLYRIRNDAAISSDTFDLTTSIPANASGFPRVDQVIARLLDTTHDSSGLRKWRPEYIVGTATSGTTLDLRTGAVSDASLGTSWLRLCDALVPSGATSIIQANIRDRRTWARGASYVYERGVAASYTTSSSTPASIDATNLRRRIELTGVPLEIRIDFGLLEASAGTIVSIVPILNAGASLSRERLITISAGSVYHSPSLHWRIAAPTPGSYLIDMQWSSSSGALVTQRANSLNSLGFSFREDLRQNADNTA